MWRNRVPSDEVCILIRVQTRNERSEKEADPWPMINERWETRLEQTCLIHVVVTVDYRRGQKLPMKTSPVTAVFDSMTDTAPLRTDRCGSFAVVSHPPLHLPV